MSIFKKKNKIQELQNPKTQEQRKQESMAILKEHGITTAEVLPYIESTDEITIRTKEEVVKRAIALLLIALYAEGLCTGEPRQEHREWVETLIQAYGADDFFSPKERAFLDNDNPEQLESINFSWQYEPLSVLLWALGFLELEDALGIPATICDVPKVGGAMKHCLIYKKIFKQANLRGKEAILDQADLIYRYDWACVEERIHHPENRTNEWGVVMERHKALNWLINYGYDGPQDWDDVSTDT